MKLKTMLAALVALLFAAGAKADELRPVEYFFKDAEITTLHLSPDGSHLGAIVRSDSARDLLIIDLASRKARKITQMSEGEVTGYFWTSNDRLIFWWSADTDKSGPSRGFLRGIYSINKDGSKRRTLSRSNYQIRNGFRVVDFMPEDPDHVLLEVRDKMRLYRDLIMMNIETGADRLVANNRSTVVRWFVNHDLEPLAALRHVENTTRRQLVFRDSIDDDWRILVEADYSEFRVHGFDEDGESLLVSSKIDRDRMALFSMNTSSGELGEPIVEDPVYDIAGSVYFSSKNRKPLYVEYSRDKPSRVYLNPGRARSRAAIDQALPETLNNIVSASDDGTRYVVRSFSDVVPGDYYLFDKQSNRLEFLASSHPWIDKDDLSEMRPIELKARDGLMLRGYLTVPKNADGPVPLVVNPHGGPHGVRDTWMFDPESQLFADRGFAVLKINFRGSGGYGRKFEQSGYHQWGLAMQDDITDAVQWTIDEGIADPNRVCIYGASYGGYATLMGLIRTPELYSCGINYVGLVDLELMYHQDTRLTMTSGFHGIGEQVLNDYIGDPEEHKDRFRATSPIHHVDKIKAPLFVIHGRLDGRVDVSHYNRLVSALKHNKKDFRSVMKRWEGHGFGAEENEIELYQDMDEFLREHLGSRERMAIN
ncbi:MAG: S9 family peptidase [Gammaproteobacteria bacterium]|nr:S9 family peptidase [Gammaproteobacteria bacterium]